MDLSEQLTEALVGRYVVEREIGAGGMATVYLARDVRHARPVALKVLKPELGAVLGVDRFLAEIKVTANLQHPNLLPLFDSGTADGLLFYVMPYVDGESLRSRLAKEKQLAVGEAVRLAVSIASALDYAHRHGVIHRDLKPENILLHEGQPLVADFGIALAVSNAGGNRITQTGLSLGTPQYMSPEQATGDRVIDARTDVYSLGAVLYEMLTGDPPHLGSTAHAVIARVLTEKPRSMRASRESVPEHVDRAVERALAKLPADRWSTAQEFALALTHADASPVSASRTSVADSAQPISNRGSLLRRAGSWLIPLAGVAAGVAVGAWAASRHQSEDSPVRYALTFDPGERFIDAQGVPLALSPDGRLLVFIGEKGGRRSLFVRPLAELHSRELPGTEEASQPFFSPDGKWVGYFARSQLRKIPINGGTSVPITEAPGFWGASWYGDDQIVISTRGALAVVSSAGGEARVFAQPDTSAGLVAMRFPFVLADGKTVTFTAFGRRGLAGARIAAASIDGGAPRTLDIVGTDPVAVINGRLIYGSGAGAIMSVPFDERRQKVLGAPEPVIDGAIVGGSGPLKAAVSRSGSVVYMSGSSTQQVVLAEPHGQVRPIIDQVGRYDHPRLSPDGKQLALEINSGSDVSIYIFDIPSGTLTRLTSGSVDLNPEWSPDGKRIVFASSRQGTPKLFWQPVDRSGPAEMLYESSRGAVLSGALTRDGGTLLLRLDATSTLSDLWYRRISGDTTTRALVVSPANELGPRLSPDGKWIAFSSDESGRSEVYITPFPGPGGRVQVSAAGGIMPVWSPDGRRLFYGVGGLGNLMAADLAFTPTVRVESREKLFDSIRLGPPTQAAYDVARDGKHFVLLQSTGADAQLIVVHDWKDELRGSAARRTR